MLSKASVHPSMGEAPRVSAGSTAPTGTIQSLKSTICSFGCPKEKMDDFRANAIHEQHHPGSWRKISQCFTSVNAPMQCSTVTSTNTGSLCKFNGADSDSSGGESFSFDDSLAFQSYSASRVPSQDLSEYTNCGVSNLIPDIGVAITQSRSKQVTSQSIVGCNQQSQKLDTSVESMGTITTLVIQNLPMNYTTSMLIQELNSQGFKGVYDFLYHPLDHQTRNHRPFAFVNFATPLIATAFYLRFHGTYLKCSHGGGGPLSVVAAMDQGVAANTARYYSRKSESRGRFRAPPINLVVDDRRVLEVGMYARKLLMDANSVCALDSGKNPGVNL